MATAGVNRFDSKFGAAFLQTVPAAPGVYRYLDAAGTVIYVGKAANLRRRLSQYRLATRKKAHRKMRRILIDAAALEFEVLPDHVAACVREAELIAQLRPKWNVVGAYAFMYPLIGICTDAGTTRLCFTTRPERFPEFAFHGAYRLRRLTRDAFFALCHLLRHIGRPVSARNQTTEKYSYVFAFEQVPPAVLHRLDAFLRGSDEAFPRGLALALLDWAPARQDSQRVQEALELLEKFNHREAGLLRTAADAGNAAEWPVPQDRRDMLVARYRQTRADADRATEPAAHQDTEAPSNKAKGRSKNRKR